MKDTEQHIKDLEESIKFLEYIQELGHDTHDYRISIHSTIDILQKHKPYTVHFSSLHVSILIKIFNHVVQTGNYHFRKKDIPNLTHTEYGNFFTLQRFGLLFYPTDDNGKRIKGGYWGINLKRTYAFLNWQYKVSKYYKRDKLIGKNFPSEEKITVHEVKNSRNAFEENVPDFVNYVENE